MTIIAVLSLCCVPQPSVLIGFSVAVAVVWGGLGLQNNSYDASSVRWT